MALLVSIRPGDRSVNPALVKDQLRMSDHEPAGMPAGAERAAHPLPKEIGGRNGPDPTRYGDWEKGGIASDF